MEVSKEKYFGLGKVPIGIGALIKGWNIPEKEFRNQNKLGVVDFRAMTSNCPHNCFHCFTNKSKKTLTLNEIKKTIDQLAELGTKTIEYLGEGEPTIDKNFFEIIEYTAKKGIHPIIFTDAATKLLNEKFVDRINKTNASICPKCDSLWNAKYQNWVVGDKTGKYFEKRNDAIKLLIKKGFNKIEKNGTTRLGFDMVISQKNYHEVEKTLRYCRENNVWIIFAFFLPAGRSGSKNFDKSLMLSMAQKKEIKEIVEKVDLEYGYNHKIYNNFLTMPCVEFIQIYGNGKVSPCPGNETDCGNIKTTSLKEIREKILENFPVHNRKTFNGYCPYRENIN